MVQKEHLHFKCILFVATLFFILSCRNSNKEEAKTTSSLFVDISLIPDDTAASTIKNLKLDNGIFYLNNQPFSGYIKKITPEGGTESINGILNGMQHGRSVSFYETGNIKDVRMYKENKSFGKSYGYWEDGKMKFEFYYLDDKRHGSNKQWYKSGQLYAFMNFKDDKEDGMQQAWRENGKPYINYEVKDGIRYGLQKSNLCYTLVDEKFK